MNKLTAEKCREQFEAWFRNHYCFPCQFSRHDKTGDYENLTVRASWRAWQASRDALPILEQQEQGDGWIEWGGGECPVGNLFSDTVMVIEVRFRTGNTERSSRSEFYSWEHHERATDIIAYRIIPEQPTNQNGEQ